MSITAALTSQLKALKLGRMLDTIDVRLAQARDDQLGYLEFLQLLLQDEIERRKTQSLRLRLQRAQQELAAATFTGDVGGGLVEASVTGTGELTGLVIKPEAIDPDDTEALADMIIAAVRAANGKAQEAASRAMPQLPDLGF